MQEIATAVDQAHELAETPPPSIFQAVEFFSVDTLMGLFMAF